MMKKALIAAAMALSLCGLSQAKDLNYSPLERSVAEYAFADDLNTFYLGGGAFVSDEIFHYLKSNLTRGKDVLRGHVEDIDREFLANEVSATRRYRDKWIILDYVHINEILLNAFDEPYATVRFYDAFRAPQLTFKDEDDAANLQRGQTISLICKYKNRVVKTIVFDNCIPLDKAIQNPIETFRKTIFEGKGAFHTSEGERVEAKQMVSLSLRQLSS